MTDWASRRWIVTGTSQGFGLAFVEQVLAAGGSVAAFSRSPQSLDALQKKAQDRLLSLAVDLTSEASIAAAVAIAEERFGGIDVLANNAGYGLLGGIEETTDAEARAIFDVNFFAPLALARAVLPGMRIRRKGFIINLSSVSGVQGLPGSGLYAATKFALEGMTEALRREIREFDLQAMIVEPGPFRTGFMEISRHHTAQRINDYQVLAKRRATEQSMPDEVMQEPARGVAVIIRAMNADKPPERLPLGGWAARLCADRYRQRLEEACDWAGLAGEADRTAAPEPDIAYE